jgi:aminoglycoside phosphotransferase (APT) family kinase protein
VAPLSPADIVAEATVGVVTSGTEVRELIERRIGPVAGEPMPMTFGHSSVTFRVQLLAGRSVIARTNARAETFAHTSRNLHVLAALGLPVPTVLALDLSLRSEPFAWMITDAFPGSDLRFELARMPRTQMTLVAEQVVSMQRAVTGLAAGEGYGFSPLSVPAPHSAWIDAVRADRAAVLRERSALLAALEATTGGHPADVFPR